MGIKDIHKKQHKDSGYELLDSDTIVVSGKTLYRIRALADGAFIKKGELAGYSLPTFVLPLATWQEYRHCHYTTINNAGQEVLSMLILPDFDRTKRFPMEAWTQWKRINKLIDKATLYIKNMIFNYYRSSYGLK